MPTLSPHLTVGGPGSDLAGFTNVQIQCALDYVAALGGGVVDLTAGTFTLADSVHLRSRVRLVGQGDATVLRKAAMKGARITAFHGYGHTDLLLDAPDRFAVGDGVITFDDHAFGFYTTVSTLIRREGNTWFTSRPHEHDYLGQHGGQVLTLFPLISAYDVEDAAVESVALDGNAEENPVMLNGCRGGGLFAMRCRRFRATDMRVRNVNSEGISFQTCEELELAQCLVEACTGNGYHPGSGSTRCHIHDCTARENAASGLFYCLRVTHLTLERCTFERNGDHGISTGARDTDNINRGLLVRDNGGCGFFFREEDAVNAAHRNLIEGCEFTTNCRTTGTAEILIQGETAGTCLRDNRITPRPGVPGVVVGPQVAGVEEA
jgi:hypothetical protein